MRPNSCYFILVIILARVNCQVEQECEPSERRLSRLKQRMSRLVRLTEKYICENSKVLKNKKMATTTTTTIATTSTTTSTSTTTIIPTTPSDPCAQEFVPVENSKKIVMCNLNANEMEEDSFRFIYLDEKLCTHVILQGVFEVSTSTYDLAIAANNINMDFFSIYTYVHSLKSKGLKVILSVGSTKAFSAEDFGEMAKIQDFRSRFISNVMDTVEKYGFNGFIPRWQHPVCPDNNCFKLNRQNDDVNFVKLVQELSSKLRPSGRLLMIQGINLILMIKKVYQFGELKPFVDYWLLECRLFDGYWSIVTAISSPVARMKNCLNGYLSHINKETIILIVTAFAPVTTLGNSKQTVIGSPIKQHEQGSKSMNGLRQICSVVNFEGGKVVHNETGKANSYAYKGKDWASFDNTFTIREKMQVALELDIAGVCLGSTSKDDYDGKVCNCGKFPLLRTINEEFRGKKGCRLPTCPQPP